MTARQYILSLAHELVVDLFAGGGGASTGIELALGRHVDIAVNHDPEAVSLHQANHPQTRHYVSDVFEVDPRAVCGDQPVGLLWASPDCKHFSNVTGRARTELENIVAVERERIANQASGRTTRLDGWLVALVVAVAATAVLTRAC